MVNVPLLRKMVEWVEAQDNLADSKRRWYQGSWYKKRIEDAIEDRNDPYCNTAMCIAGKVAANAGWKPVYDASYDSEDLFVYASTATKHGQVETIERIGAAELGLDTDDAERLFHGDNDADRIRLIAEEIAGERL